MEKRDEGFSSGTASAPSIDWLAEAYRTYAMGCSLNRGESEAVIKALDEAKRLAAAWEDTAAMFSRNEGYYRSMIDAIGAMLGPEAYTQDDGGVVPDVLRAKVVELCAKRLKAQSPS